MIDRKKITNNVKYLSKYIFNKFYKNQDEGLHEDIKECINLIFEKIMNTEEIEILFDNYMDRHLKEYIQI